MADVTMAQVAGSYEANTLVGQDAGGDIDVLSQGGYLAIALSADGTTEGTLFVPEGDEDGKDYTADLTGTWSLNASDDIVFEHAADRFIRDVAWQYYDAGTPDRQPVRPRGAFAAR